MSDDLAERLRLPSFSKRYRLAAADRIEELEKQNASLEAKLAKAVEALQFYRSAVNLRIGCEITHAMQEAHSHAEAFITKIKGEQQ